MHRKQILPPTWVIRHDLPADGVTNMARDLALLDTVTAGTATWRWYAWDRPTVSFGRNERTTGWYTAASVAGAGLAVVRRPTGGRALLHARELTYSVTLPLPAQVGWRQAYDAINEVLLTVLREAGVPAVLSEGAAVPPDGLRCFDLPAPGEIAVHGRKLVGSAVWRQGAGYLQHGSLLIHDDQARLMEARCDAPTADPWPPNAPPLAATLSALFPTLETNAIVARLTAALPTVLRSLQVADEIGEAPRDATTSEAMSSETPANEMLSHEVLARHRVAMNDPSWIWRR